MLSLLHFPLLHFLKWHCCDATKLFFSMFIGLFLYVCTFFGFMLSIIPKLVVIEIRKYLCLQEIGVAQYFCNANFSVRTCMDTIHAFRLTEIRQSVTKEREMCLILCSAIWPSSPAHFTNGCYFAIRKSTSKGTQQSNFLIPIWK